jgi:hypothetical protein
MSRWILGFVCVASLLCVSVASAQEEGAKKGRRGGPRGGGFNREEVIKKYDKDGDGKLSDDEKAEARKDMEADMAKRREEMTKKYDKDGDGKLNDEERAELRKEFAGRGGRGPGGAGGPSREEMLKKFDKDKDGKLSEEERAEMRKEFPGRRGGRRPGGDQKPEEKKEI